jgi:hypothetical protein
VIGQEIVATFNQRQCFRDISYRLDIKAKVFLLDASERREANEKVAKLRQDQESKWAQRAKVSVTSRAMA